MNLVADESVDRQIIEKLRRHGYNVWYIEEISPSISDKEVLELANKNDALLITSDKDFGELVFRQNLISFGVILIRLSGQPAEIKGNIVTSSISKQLAEMIGNFTVIEPKRIRKIES